MSRTIDIHESEEYKHVFNAMKMARCDIAEHVDNRKLIVFETVPMAFDESDRTSDPNYKFGAERWHSIYKQILDSTSGLEDLKRAIDKAFEIS